MHLHIIGIAGTFMGGLAQLAQQAGHTVSGCDAAIYPPMSTQLEKAGIELTDNFDAEHLRRDADVQVIGNIMSRGKPLVEAILNEGLRYQSGPQWLYENILRDKWVIAVSGTHGKTTTASMVAWILQAAGQEPGFLIGGVPKNFDCSARLGNSKFFVIEADEYDTAFFDKRSKFVHYHPKTLVINNLEFDHADIFDDLAAIQRQFHHLIRLVPSEGKILAPTSEAAVADTLEQGCWSSLESLNTDDGWSIHARLKDYTSFDILFKGEVMGTVEWALMGEHNAHNALAAIAAAHHVGVSVNDAVVALANFQGVKRRLEQYAAIGNITMYDDFAHHPTAIKTTLSGLRANLGKISRILVVFEPRSNTMQLGVHQQTLAQSWALADHVYAYQSPSLEWALTDLQSTTDMTIESDIDKLVDSIVSNVKSQDHIVIMSNGGFGGLREKLKIALENDHE